MVHGWLEEEDGGMLRGWGRGSGMFRDWDHGWQVAAVAR
jgi:hypothetical protein